MNAADTAWLLVSSALVLMMTLPGLALFYGGMVASRNVLSVLMHCFAITVAVSLVWFIAGYSLVFSDGAGLNAYIGGFEHLFSRGINASELNGSVPEPLFFLFQMTFAIITPALIVGAYAERIRFGVMLWFSILWSLLVYAPVAHWVWGGGWLADLGVLDFAGGLVVHTTAGVAALCAALVIGKRHQYPDVSPPHNLTMTTIGAGMLWVGWFGFNGGSALAADGTASQAILVTHMAASAAALTWMCMEWLRFGKPSILGVVTGMVAGLGTITPASGYVGVAGAVLIGVMAGLVCFTATLYIKRKLLIDDSLDVFPVHGVGGILGTLLLAFFATKSLGGVGLEHSALQQLQIQAVGVVAVFVYTAVITWLILKFLSLFVPLRVSVEEEIEGLDSVQQNESGYRF